MINYSILLKKNLSNIYIIIICFIFSVFVGYYIYIEKGFHSKITIDLSRSVIFYDTYPGLFSEINDLISQARTSHNINSLTKSNLIPRSNKEFELNFFTKNNKSLESVIEIYNTHLCNSINILIYIKIESLRKQSEPSLTSLKDFHNQKFWLSVIDYKNNPDAYGAKCMYEIKPVNKWDLIIFFVIFFQIIGFGGIILFKK